MSGSKWYGCCGKVICTGCMYAPVYDNQGNEVVKKICPFCRTPPPMTDEDMVKRYKMRMELNDANAIYSLGGFYVQGSHGLPQSITKALELWHRAGSLPLLYGKLIKEYSNYWDLLPIN